MGAAPPLEHVEDHGLREAATLCQVVEEISSELELRPLLTRIVAHACELLGADDGSIGLFDPVRNVIRTEAVYRMPAREQGAEVPANVGLAGKVFASGAPLILDRYGDLGDVPLPELAENSVIGVPIRSHGHLVGFFGIGARPPRKFDSRDLATLQLFARHAALAIDNAVRYQREKSRSERLALIARVSRLVSAGLEPMDLVATAAQVIHEQLGYANVVIPLLEDEHLVYRAHAGAYREIFREEYRLHVSQGITGAAVRTHAAQVVNDVTQDPRYVPPPLPIDVTAELAVPIVLGHEVFGVVNIEGRAAFDREDISSIQVIADHLAVAIKNARLFDDARAAAVMRERQRLARDLHDSVTQVLSSISLMSQSIIAAYKKDAQEGERRARRIEELSQLAFAEMRRLLNELRPVATGTTATRAGALAEIESYGLKRALQRLLAVLAPETADVRFDFANYRFQALEHEEALYRICQEAVSNSLRHGNARRITIRAEVIDARHIRVEVADDGKGFDATEPTVLVQTALGGLGMQTMRERAIALGGATTIHSKPGQGTRVIVDLPRSDR
ncbi:MAG TPA: GAF domain-containing sensor histidine kinase [Steroidobacteraceae bacterium]|jgi:signal transduction histidine kinase|nr:GAF domain-containing sensor histidine kinase [Steroidobacteraceae bacterium]